MTITEKNNAVLLMHCPDQKGIVAKITDFLFENNGNIVHLEQHVDQTNNRFFMRAEWELEGFQIPEDKIAEYFDTLIGNKLQITSQLHFTHRKPNMALFVSKMSHCLYDILQRYQSEEWYVNIPFIISNHPDLAYIAEKFNIPFHVFPVNSTNKQEMEAQELKLLKEADVDFIVLARYMQIISPEFINHYTNRIINIHHSFLPAFPGAKPYHSAFERGVKIIGATGHYVTSELDAGPIIVQDVEHINHKADITDMVRKGKDLEKFVLSRAIWNHLNHKILAYNNKTIIF